MSQMEQGMETIIKTFHQHAGKEGNPDTLSKKEFKQLVNKDMPNSLKVRPDQWGRRVQPATVRKKIPAPST